MNKMTPLYSPEDCSRLDRKIQATRAVCCCLAAAALIACVTLCVLTDSANAGRNELACIAIWVLAGWVVLYLRRFTLKEARDERQHAEMLHSGDKETLRGRVTVTKERMRIVNSIRFTLVSVENEQGTRRLRVCTSREKKLRAAGDTLTLYVVNGYVAGYDCKVNSDE